MRAVVPETAEIEAEALAFEREAHGMLDGDPELRMKLRMRMGNAALRGESRGIKKGREEVEAAIRNFGEAVSEAWHAVSWDDSENFRLPTLTEVRERVGRSEMHGADLKLVLRMLRLSFRDE